jgi:hypothetical protein
MDRTGSGYGGSLNLLACRAANVVDGFQKMLWALQLPAKFGQLGATWVAQISVQFEKPRLFFGIQLHKQRPMLVAGKVNYLLRGLTVTIIGVIWILNLSYMVMVVMMVIF